MKIRTKTVRYAFDSMLTSLATNTALSTATRYDFSSITLRIPETASRTFISVIAEVTFGDAYTATGNSITGVRMGIKLGAAAFADTDRTSLTPQVNEHGHEIWRLDVTDYFTTNFGSGQTQTCQVGFAVSTTTASALTEMATCKLLITYSHDDDDVSTERLKTIGIPLHSHHVSLTSSFVEVGTTSTTAAPANQIPALDTYLEESGKVYCQAYLETNMYNGSPGGANTSDMSWALSIDGGADINRGKDTQALGTQRPIEDIMLWDTTTYSTGSAHSVSMKITDTLAPTTPGLILWVTYSYNKDTSTRVMCQQAIPLTSNDTDFGPIDISINPGNATDPITLIAKFDVDEPGSITLKQSAAVLTYINVTGGTTQIAAGGQTNRTYQPGLVCEMQIIHRGDFSSGWSIARGLNRWTLKIQHSLIQRANVRGYVLVTYSADVPSAGCESVSRVAVFHQAQYANLALIYQLALGTQRIPVLNSPYRINGVFLHGQMRQSSALILQWAVKVQTGEYPNEEWRAIEQSKLTYGISYVQSYNWMVPVTRKFNRDNLHTGKMNIEAEHVWAVLSTATYGFASSIVVSFHNISYTVAGTVTINGTPAADGKTVRIMAKDVENNVEEVTSAVISGGAGAFTAQVPDNTRSYWTEYDGVTVFGRSAMSNKNPYPATAAEMRDAVGYGTWSAGWLMEEQLGHLIAAFGGTHLTPSAVPISYRVSGPVANDRAVQISGTSFDGGNVFDVGATDDLICAGVARLDAVPATSWLLVSKGSGAHYRSLFSPIGGATMTTYVDDSVTSKAAAVTAPGVGEWFAWMSVFDRGTNQLRLATYRFSDALLTVSTATSTTGVGSLSNISAFQIGRTAGAWTVAAQYIGVGSGIATGMVTNLGSALGNFVSKILNP